MIKTIKVKHHPNPKSYLNYSPKLHWCGKLANTTHSCTGGLGYTEVYTLSHIEVKA